MHWSCKNTKFLLYAMTTSWTLLPPYPSFFITFLSSPSPLSSPSIPLSFPPSLLLFLPFFYSFLPLPTGWICPFQAFCELWSQCNRSSDVWVHIPSWPSATPRCDCLHEESCSHINWCVCVFVLLWYMWQSQVEIKHYFISYSGHTTAFKALSCRTSIKGRAHTWCVDICRIPRCLRSAYEPHP